MAIVYRTENKLNGKFYYGVHSGSNNSYLGSGVLLKKAINKYGRKNFIRRTIATFDTVQEAYAFESIMVDEALVNNKQCYNVLSGGKGGFNDEHIRQGIAASVKKRTGSKLSEETKQKMRDSSYRSKPVVDIVTGKEWPSLSDAAKELNIPEKTLNNWINGVSPNKSNIMRKEGVDLSQK